MIGDALAILCLSAVAGVNLAVGCIELRMGRLQWWQAPMSFAIAAFMVLLGVVSVTI